ncbi:MAG TPA: hypothetical protein VES60_04020 [Nakamurella sp.]|nr:hypothetical protein [Nakamurella sp.]
MRAKVPFGPTFTAADGLEAFTTASTRLVSGRPLTWYGPSLRDAATFSGQPHHAMRCSPRPELVAGPLSPGHRCQHGR